MPPTLPEVSGYNGGADGVAAALFSLGAQNRAILFRKPAFCPEVGWKIFCQLVLVSLCRRSGGQRWMENHVVLCLWPQNKRAKQHERGSGGENRDVSSSTDRKLSRCYTPALMTTTAAFSCSSTVAV